MNRYNLYAIGVRQTVLAKVQELLGLTGTPDVGDGFILRIDAENYFGTTPAETFLHFCENMSIAYPLKFRSLISVRVPGCQELAIRRNGDSKTHLKMRNLNGYVQANLSSDTVLGYVHWMCKKCGKKYETVFWEGNKSETEAATTMADTSKLAGGKITVETTVIDTNATTTDASTPAIPEKSYLCNSIVEDRIKLAFFMECGNSFYGTTLTYLRTQLPDIDAKTIEVVLEAAPWAKKKYSRWVYCAEPHIAEQKQKPTVAGKPPVSAKPPVSICCCLLSLICKASIYGNEG